MSNPMLYRPMLDRVNSVQRERLEENEWRSWPERWQDTSNRAMRAVMEFGWAMEEGRKGEAIRHAADAANLLVISLRVAEGDLGDGHAESS